MRACTYGAGAISGDLAAQLHRAGANVSVVTRGEHPGAMRWNRLLLEINGDTRMATPAARETALR